MEAAVATEQAIHPRTGARLVTEFSMSRGVRQRLGAYAERVEKAEDLSGALKRALANAPALLDVVVTRDAGEESQD